MTTNHINYYELTGDHFIAGKWLPGDGDEIAPENPGEQQTGWQGKSASASLVARAVDSARASFQQWQLTDFAEREALVLAFAEMIKANQDALADVIHLETGKPLWESKTEAATVVAKVKTSIESFHARTGTINTASAQQVTVLTHRPHGVLGVLGPYNFPAHLPNGHIVPALLAGNTLVLKPSERTPATAEFMLRCWQAAGLPDGVINLVQGAALTGQALSQHDDIDGLLFTGSSRTGAALHRHFGGKPEKLLALEMGGNNPLVVDTVADIKAAVFAILQSAFISAGQRCTCSRRLIMINHEDNRRLLDALVTATKALTVGFQDHAFMGPVIHNGAADALLAAQDNLLSLGAKSLLPVQRLVTGKPLLSPGILDVTDVQELPDEEYFGPLLQVIWVPDMAQAVSVANNTRFGLSSGLLSDSESAWQYFYQRTRAGIVNWNKPITGASGANPFGGIGASGNHRPSAYYAADYCAHPMASVLSNTLSLPEKLLPGVEL